MTRTAYTIHDYTPGTRVEMHPATDRWMRGDRFGTVKTVGRLYVTVELDRSGHTVKVRPEDITHAD
jgi:hypothetical protein